MPHVDIFMSRNRHCSSFANFFVGTHNENYHLIHHMFPLIPSWKWAEANKILMEDQTYSKLNQTYGWNSIFNDIVSEANSNPKEGINSSITYGSNFNTIS